MERTLRLTAGRSYVEHLTADGCAQLRGVRGSFGREAQHVNPLYGPGKLRMRRLVRGFEIIVIALRHHFMLQQELGAIQLTVGTCYLDFRLIVVGSRRRNLAALNKADGLTLGHVLPRPNIQFDQAAGDLGIDMKHPAWVGHNTGSEHQAIRNRLRMDGGNLDRCFLGPILTRGAALLMAAEACDERKGRKPISNSHGSISDAAT